VPTELRDYQVRAIEQVRAELRAGKRSVVLVVPTGGGKTRIGAEIAKSHVARGGRVIWIAHRAELVKQAATRLTDEGLDVGIVAAGVAPTPNAPVQVASVQTLAARGERPGATLVVLDEAHHYVAAQWGEIAEHYVDAWRVGLTATPERSDGEPLGDLFGALVAPVTVAELTAAGYLVKCEVLAPKRRLPRAMAGDPVDRYLEIARGRRAIFFAATVEQAQELASRLDASNVPAACIHAETPADERAEALAQFARGELLALTNCHVLTEGTDLPPAEVCVLARGFSHASNYLQCVGRVLRPAPGKTSALVLDLCGVSRTHGVPDDAREYSLDGRAIRVVGKETESNESTGGVVAAPTIVNEQLERVKAIAVVAAKWTRGRRGVERAVLESLLRDARDRGRQPGWAAHRFRERFGRFPWQRPVSA
jgi:DNA repair protein RadD